MRNILAKDLKIKFVETLNEVSGFSYEEGNPFLIKIGPRRFFIFLRNLTPAYLRNSPDVTRIQLPYSEHFDKIFKANIPFIALGYDVDNDTLVSWNPMRLKDRLNTKSNVSLYSRNSLQAKLKPNEFRTTCLSNGETIVFFRRDTLKLFFDSMHDLFENYQSKKSKNNDNPNEYEADFRIDKLLTITDKQLLNTLKPLLKKNRVLEAVEVSAKHYSGRYKNMTFKDWFRLVNDIYRKNGS